MTRTHSNPEGIDGKEIVMESPLDRPEPAAEVSVEKMGEGRRLVGAFLAPRRTFTDIARRPTFLLPLVVAWIASMSVGYLFAHRVFTERAVEQTARTSIERTLALEGVDRPPTEAEVRDRVAAVRGLRRLWPIGTTLELFGIVFGVSVLFFLLFRLLREHPSFRGMLAVTSWSWMVWTLVFAVGAWLLVWLADPAALDPADPYTLSVVHLGHLVPAGWVAPLHVVATNLSLQNLWFLALLAVGYGMLVRRASPARTAGMVFTVGLVVFVLRGIAGL